jgi:hypothetical protein
MIIMKKVYKTPMIVLNNMDLLKDLLLVNSIIVGDEEVGEQGVKEFEDDINQKLEEKEFGSLW